ncbi:MAG: 4Fe-4S binding protein [Candidatus Omnitrophica bacterium]|nr:4Fe-4S binding protein [Candidatus Omnitrophota bacterium]
MRYPKLRELKEAIRAIFSSPYTSRFPYEPHEPYERFRGRPYFYEKDCIGCAACAQVCPAKAITFEDHLKGALAKRKLTIHWDICIFCGQCEANCPTSKGIMLSREFDLATTEKREELKQAIEKEFILCECCGSPVLPYDQYAWVVKRIGPLSFSNTSLLLFYLRSAGLALKEKIIPNPEKKFNRAMRIKILCPNCRREAVLKS